MTSVLRRFRIPGPILGLVAILALFSVILDRNGLLGNFFGWPNCQGLLHQCRVQTIVALGMLLIILTGGIDLSVGSVVALVTVVSMQTFRLTEARGYSPLESSLAAIGCGVAAGAICGLVNGLVITRLSLSPFVATLGMMSVARGTAVWLSGRGVIGFKGNRPGWFDTLQLAEIDWPWFVNPGVWLALALALLIGVVLRGTVFGRHCYAVGSNPATARLCGINVPATKVTVYTIAGILSGIAGILAWSKSASGNPGDHVGLELEVIAAVVIGGASLTGGQGSVGRTLLGVLILAIVENGLSFCQVPVEAKYILIGVIVVINTALSVRHRQKGE